MIIYKVDKIFNSIIIKYISSSMIGKTVLFLLVLAFVSQSRHLFEEHDNTGIFNGAIIEIVASNGDLMATC